jgi:hypothetical protein
MPATVAIPESLYPEAAAPKSTRPPGIDELAQILQRRHQLRKLPKMRASPFRNHGDRTVDKFRAAYEVSI